jgi:hypothetical protein
MFINNYYDSSVLYSVIRPDTIFKNRTYADFLGEFWKWLYSIDCDQNNVGDVVFLRGVAKGDDPKQGYLGAPVVRVADDALRISKEQGIFFCNITSNAEAINERVDYSEAQLRAQCIADLNQSIVPTPAQIIIDGNPIVLPEGVNITDFRTITSEFILKVFDAEYGESIAPFMDVVLNPGQYSCVAGAYDFIITFDEPGLHYIYNVGRGKPWARGPYTTESYYEVEVLDTNLSGIHTDAIPALNKVNSKLSISNRIFSMLHKMEQDKIIDSKKLTKLKDMIKLRESLQ